MNDFRFPYCPKCGDSFLMREDIYEELEECGNTFYCPRGHALEICRSSIVSRFRTEKRQSVLRLNIIHRLQKRIESLRGACPYCNCVPHNMVKHIQAQHKSKGN